MIFFGAFYFTPSAIRWRARCREESESFSVAVKSGTNLTTLEVREYPLNKIAICIYLILVLGVLLISAWDELNFVSPYEDGQCAFIRSSLCIEASRQSRSREAAEGEL